jgi:bacitracin transport system permease protein
MSLAALFMPIIGVSYFSDMGNVVDVMTFYKWTAFGFTQWIILPVVLGMLCTLLMYEENQNDMLKQLWIVPVSRLNYFFSKFTVVFLYSVGFMVVVVAASVFCALLFGFITFSWESTFFLLIKCMEIGIITPISMLPILTVAAMQKGYILPVCGTLIYAFLGFILLMVNMYLHPLSSMSAIVTHNIPGVSLNQTMNIPAAILCISVWGAVSVIIANFALRARK